MIDRQRFDRDGFIADIPVLDPAETARYRGAIEELYRRLDPGLQRYFINLHAVLGWAAELGRHPRILDAVQALLGPDLLLWKSKAFVKFPGPGHVAWHQDLPHWNLEPAEAVTAWVALTEVTEANGCVRVVRGSHQGGSRASAAAQDPDSLLSAGLQFPVSADEERAAVPMRLRAGSISLHHGMIVHGSGPNATAAPRIGLALVYAPAHVRQRSAPDTHVVLVRGRERNGGFFPPDPPPQGDGDAQHAAAATYFTRLKTGQIAYNVR